MRSLIPRALTVISMSMVLSAVLAAPVNSRWAFSAAFSGYAADTCISDLTQFGPWFVAFSGYGCATIESTHGSSWLHAAPLQSKTPAETHASLILGPAFAGPIRVQSHLLTVAQLRTQSPPNPWEVGWLLWHYTDNQHFYYIILRTDGWELGKEDPGYPGNQRFLTSGSSPQFPIGHWYTVEVTQNQTNEITVQVNGRTLVTFTDTERPYGAGNIGLYTEDAHVHCDTVRVAEL